MNKYNAHIRIYIHKYIHIYIYICTYIYIFMYTYILLCHTYYAYEYICIGGESYKVLKSLLQNFEAADKVLSATMKGTHVCLNMCFILWLQIYLYAYMYLHIFD
jgi:hypothetical protein